MDVCEWMEAQCFPAQFWTFLFVRSFGGLGVSLCVGGEVFGDFGVWLFMAECLATFECDFSWQAQCLVTFDCHFSWKAQYLVALQGI